MAITVKSDAMRELVQLADSLAIAAKAVQMRIALLDRRAGQTDSYDVYDLNQDINSVYGLNDKLSKIVTNVIDAN